MTSVFFCGANGKYVFTVEFLDSLLGPTINGHSEHETTSLAGNIKSEPSHILSPPITPPQTTVADSDSFDHSSQNQNSQVQSQNMATQCLLNLIQGQKVQPSLPVIHNKSLEQLLQEPSIFAPTSQPNTVHVQPPVTQQVTKIIVLIMKSES